jgi:hypothetical protein
MGIAPSHFERDLVLNDPSEEREEEEEKDRTERAKQRAMMHSIGFEEDIPGDLECSICAEVSALFCICFLFLLFEDSRARARSVSKKERFAAFPAMMLKMISQNLQGYESLRAFMITNPQF